MRKNLCVFALLASAVLPSVAHAETTVRHFHGISANSSFSSSDATGCLNTFVGLSAFENLTRAPGSAEERTYAYISVTQFDFCQFILVSSISGFVDLAPEAFDTRGKLQEARLAASVDLYDARSNSTVPVSIDLTWTAYGETVRGSSTFRSVYPEERVWSRQNGSARQANVTGTILVGGTNVTPQPAEFGDITDNVTGSVTTIR